MKFKNNVNNNPSARPEVRGTVDVDGGAYYRQSFRSLVHTHDISSSGLRTDGHGQTGRVKFIKSCQTQPPHYRQTDRQTPPPSSSCPPGPFFVPFQKV